MTNQELIKLAQLLGGNDSTPKLAISLAWTNFLNHCYSRDVRYDTIKYYTKAFDKVNEYLKSINITYIEDITKQTMNSMIIHFKSVIRRNGKVWSNNTTNDHIEIIKQVVKVNHELDFVTHNNISSFKNLPKDPSITKVITQGNEDKILDYLKNLDLSKGTNLRNTLFLYLFKESGVRINELLNIEVENINLEERIIILSFTKTRKIRDIFFSNYTKDLLIQYLEIVKEDKYLFSNEDKSKPMLRGSVYDFFNIIKRRLNINQSISPHKWRHTLATRLIKENVNTFSVQRILGHANISTTETYVHLDNNKIKKDLEKIF